MLENTSTIDMKSLTKFAGVGVFVGTSDIYLPTVFSNLINKMKTIAQTNIFLNVEITSNPTEPVETRVTVTEYPDALYHITAKYGFTEFPIEISEILEDAVHHGLPDITQTKTIYFVDLESINVQVKNPIRAIIYHVYAFQKRSFTGNRTLR